MGIMYQVTDLGILPSGTSSHAHAITDTGQVVGRADVLIKPKWKPSLVDHAFHWDRHRDPPMVDLHDDWSWLKSSAFSVYDFNGPMTGWVVGGTSLINDLNPAGDAFYCDNPFFKFPTLRDLDKSVTPPNCEHSEGH